MFKKRVGSGRSHRRRVPDPRLRVDLKGEEFVWRILGRQLVHSDSFRQELGVRKR